MTDIPDEVFTPPPARRPYNGRGDLATRGRIMIAVDMMMAGASIVTIANRLDSPPDAVRRWLNLPSALRRIDRIQREAGERLVRSLVTTGLGSVLTLAELQRTHDSTGAPVPMQVRVQAANGALRALGIGSRIDPLSVLEASIPAADEGDDVLERIDLIANRLDRVEIIDVETDE